MKANRDAAIELTCPRCGEKFKKTIRWMEQHPEFPCEGECGVVFKSDEFVAKLDSALTDAARQFKNLKF